MEPENYNQETPQVEQSKLASSLFTVTPLSKYLAMALFIILPFVGGWIGYTFAPEKVVEVEKVVMVESSAKNEEIIKVLPDPSVEYSMKVQKGGFEYELAGPDGPTDASGNNLYIRNINTGEVVETKYWLRFSDKIATVGNDSFVLVGDDDSGTNVGLNIVRLTASGIEVSDVSLPAGLTAIEQILCEMGCRRGVNWEVDFKDGLPILAVDLYEPKTYNELILQYQSFENDFSEKDLIDEKMRTMNFVQRYQFEL